MLRPSSTEWPIWHDDPWQNPQPRDEVVPLRHDIALALYLEKQQARRALAIRRFDLWTTAIGLCALLARVGRVFSGARALPSERPSSSYLEDEESVRPSAISLATLRVNRGQGADGMDCAQNRRHAELERCRVDLGASGQES
jgi:hypothetical protein